MIHHTCDGCRQPLGPEDSRFVLRMEVYRALGQDSDTGDDRDHLEEIDEYLEGLDDFADDHAADAVYQQLRFDLCEACRKNFLIDPLGRRAKQLNFSQN